MNQGILKKPSVFDYLGVVLMLFASRSIILWGDLGAATSYYIFFVYSIFLFFKKRARLQKNSGFLYSIILIFAIAFNRFVLNTNILGNMWAASVLVCISSMFFYSSYDIRTFRKCFLNVLYLILLFNIPIHLIDISIGFPWVKSSYIDEFHTGRMFLIYNLGKGRLCGIWGEPGVTQIFINTAFLLYLPELKSKTLVKRDKYKLIVLFIALLLGTSTMGYLVFAGIIFSAFYSSFKHLSFSKKIVLIPLVTIAIALLVFSPAVQDKFAPGKDSGGSFGQRYSDNAACLAMALDRPFTGYGFGTVEYEAVSFRYDNFSNSNGVLAFAARIGLWWILLYVIFLYKGLKMWKLGVPTLFTLILILMMEFNEDFIEFPMSFIYLMQFGKKEILE